MKRRITHSPDSPNSWSTSIPASDEVLIPAGKPEASILNTEWETRKATAIEFLQYYCGGGVRINAVKGIEFDFRLTTLSSMNSYEHYASKRQAFGGVVAHQADNILTTSNVILTMRKIKGDGREFYHSLENLLPSIRKHVAGLGAMYHARQTNFQSYLDGEYLFLGALFSNGNGEWCIPTITVDTNNGHKLVTTGLLPLTAKVITEKFIVIATV